jgi:hypothetical protein
VIAEIAMAATLLAAPADPVTPAPSPRVVAPSRGMVGRFLDSNVLKVWKGATYSERMTWLCIRRHESMSYTGQNPTSSASGAGQWIDSTWRGVARYVKVDGVFVARGYSRAKHAPAWVQDAAYRHVYKRHGLSMWHGTGCAGT